MNLDESEKDTPSPASPKKLSRKEKKALKRAEKAAAKVAKQETPPLAASAKPESSQQENKEVDAELEPAPVPEVKPTTYSAWEKISPPAKRKKQLATMESGYKEVLALVHSMRENQEVLMHSFKKLPEAVDSVKKLAEHSAQQSELLTAMNEQIQSGSAGKFNETLTSMDKTTQLLLERAQRSEERLYSMLRRAQRRIAFMTLLVLMLFLGTAGAILFLAFPDQTNTWLEERGWRKTEEVTTDSVPVIADEISATATASEEVVLTPEEPESAPENTALLENRTEETILVEGELPESGEETEEETDPSPLPDDEAPGETSSEEDAE